MAKAIAAQIEKTEAELNQLGSDDALAVAKRLKAARESFVRVVEFVVGSMKSSPNAVFAGSVPYLLMAGRLVAGWQLGRSLLVATELAAKGQDAPFMQAKIVTARFFAEHVLNGVPATADSIVDGAESATAMTLDAF